MKLNTSNTFSPVSYEEAEQKVEMLRAPPAIYNPRRLLEKPIPVIPSVIPSNIPVSKPLEAIVQNGPERPRKRRPRRRHSMLDSLLQRTTVIKRARVEMNNTNQSGVYQQTNQQQEENPSANNSDDMSHITSDSTSREDTSIVNNSEAIDASNEIVLITNQSNSEREVASTAPMVENSYHACPKIDLRTSEKIVDSHFESVNSTNPIVSGTNSILEISTITVSANASQQIFDKSKSIVSDIQMINPVILDESNVTLLPITGCSNQSDVAQIDQLLFGKNVSTERNSGITNQKERADGDILISPGCSHWTDSEVILQSRLNIALNDSRSETQHKPEMVPLYETTTENSNEISSILTDNDDGNIEFEHTERFPKPMAATANHLNKIEDDIVSGNLGFNKTVSVWTMTV